MVAGVPTASAPAGTSVPSSRTELAATMAPRWTTTPWRTIEHGREVYVAKGREYRNGLRRIG